MKDRVIKISVDVSAFRKIELWTSVTGEAGTLHTFEKTPGAESSSLEWELLDSKHISKRVLKLLALAHEKLEKELS